MAPTHIYILITLIIVAVLGFVFLTAKYRNRQLILKERLKIQENTIEELKTQCLKIETEREIIRNEKDSLNTQLTRQITEFNNLKEQSLIRAKEVNEQQERLRKDFELMASKILDEKSEKFTLQNKENIKQILNPLQEKIKTFESKVEQSQKESISMHSALKEQLLGLKDLNQQMTKEATNLTRALKGDSKLQGNWGELVLERVLEKSGLEKDREYFIQQSFKLEDGSRVLPDVVLHLPDAKKMIIDSKVSLTDYNKYINATEESQKAIYLKGHLNSIKRHIDQLSSKNYQDLYDIETPNFVLMFIPIEPAFAIALNEDNNLYNKAFEKNIVIVTPTTLLATLRTIDSMWNTEKQQRNALEIAKQAGALYDKFDGLMKDLIGIGKRIDASKADYNAAMNKLFQGRGNLIRSVQKLKKMGATAKKELPQSIINRANETNDDDE